MEKEFQRKINFLFFEKFHQIRDKNNRKPKGTGLGLSIAKRIVEAHFVEIPNEKGILQKQKGKIWIESNENEGTTFLMQFNKHTS